MNKERLEHARSVGFVPIDLTKSEKLEELIEAAIGTPEVDAAVDCVGFEARGHGDDATVERPAVVLNSLMAITRAAGGIGIPGLYVTDDPGAKDESARRGALGLRFGLGWAKSHRFYTGQTPVLRYFRSLMEGVMNDRIHVAKIVNATVIPLEEAVRGYEEFDKGAPRKYVLDPHGTFKM